MIVSPTGIIIITAVIAVIFVPYCPRQLHAELDLVSKSCDRSPHKDLCRSIALGPTSPELKDTHGLVEVFLKAALTNATEIHNYITEMLTGKLDPFVEQCLLDCSDNYEDVMDQLDDSITALDSRAYDDIESWIKSAVNDVELCEEGFRERRGYRSPLRGVNRMFSQICSVVLSINKVLKEENEYW